MKPSTRIIFEYEIRDKSGKVIKRGIIKGHSFVENYTKLLLQMFYQGTTFSLIPRGETEKTFSQSDITTCTVMGNVSDDPDNFYKYGILVGTGTTTPTPSDTDLESVIVHDTTYLEYSDMVCETTDIDYDTITSSFTLKRDFSNKTDDQDITISEVGFACKILQNGSTPYYVLLARDVIPEEERPTIPPGGVLTIRARVENTI